MKVRPWLIFGILWIILLAMLFSYASGAEPTDYRTPTVNELVGTLRVEVMQDLVQAMMKTRDLAKLELALTMPCAKVWVGTRTVSGYDYYGIESDLTECQDE